MKPQSSRLGNKKKKKNKKNLNPLETEDLNYSPWCWRYFYSELQNLDTINLDRNKRKEQQMRRCCSSKYAPISIVASVPLFAKYNTHSSKNK